ncbi:MAG: hypothetical protein QM635_02695 [Microbacteriaceae bacterium]
MENENGSPDLVAVVATNGLDGYVYSAELDAYDAAPSSGEPEDSEDPESEDPESEDLESWQAEQNARGHEPLTVYASDGTTVIGEFEFADLSTATPLPTNGTYLPD